MIILTKGQSQPLTPIDDIPLQHVAFELGWDQAQTLPLIGRLLKPEQPIDLDASCLLYSGDGKLLDKIGCDHLVSRCAAVRHSGDNTAGDSDGEDEIIAMDLTRIAPEIKVLLFTVTSFSGQTLDHVQNAYGRLIDLDRRMDLVSFDLTTIGPHTGIVLARIYRNETGWHVQAIGETVDARSIDDIEPTILAPWLAITPA